MESTFDRSAAKRPTNLSINSDLLRQAKELKINLSKAFEEHLCELVREARAERWLAENKESIEDYNRRVEEEGVFSESLRLF